MNIYESLVYRSTYDENYNQCWLLLDGNHYNVITNIKGLVASDDFCQKCFFCFGRNKTSFDKHECNSVLDKPHKTNNRICKDAAHYLQSKFCKGSKEELESRMNSNKNVNMIPKIIETVNNPRYIVYDFETDTHTNIHKPNLCIASVIKVADDGTYESSLKETVTFSGYDCCAKFCDWLFTSENSNSTVIAHNQAGYDGKFILSWCLDKGMMPSTYIQQGNRITYMAFSK